MEFDFDIAKQFNNMEDVVSLSQEDKDKIYTYFKWNLKSLDARVTEETFQETIFRATIMTYVSSTK